MLLSGVVPNLLSIANVRRVASPLFRIASAMMNPPIIRKMMGFAKPITALLKLSTPIMGWMKSMIKDVTARWRASVAHMIMANTSNAIAAWPE